MNLILLIKLGLIFALKYFINKNFDQNKPKVLLYNKFFINKFWNYSFFSNWKPLWLIRSVYIHSILYFSYHLIAKIFNKKVFFFKRSLKQLNDVRWLIILVIKQNMGKMLNVKMPFFPVWPPNFVLEPEILRRVASRFDNI